MDDVELALLGSKEAAKRLTEAGVLLMQGDCLTQTGGSSDVLYAGAELETLRHMTSVRIAARP